MKKIFKIASYDFKRLMFNPISIAGLVVVLLLCVILGFSYKITPSTDYSANVSGSTTQNVYENFTYRLNPDEDNKHDLDALLTDAENYLTAMQNSLDYETLDSINRDFQTLDDFLEKISIYDDPSYADEEEVKNYVQNYAIAPTQDLHDFVLYFDALGEFESNVIFSTKDFDRLSEISDTFFDIIASSDTITILDNFGANRGLIEEMNRIVNGAFVEGRLDSQLVQDLQTNYIDKAQTKLADIENEIENLNSSVTSYDTTHREEMTSLISNYKLTCESAKRGVELELHLFIADAIERKFGSSTELTHFTHVTQEDAQVALAKINYFLDDDGLYYTAYQTPLNFNTASFQVTLYDQAYFLMAIIGFLTVIFGIFLTYKLFGLDRRNGKMDTILSQNVTFGQVFVGKFLAIIFCTLFVLVAFCIVSLTLGSIFYPALPNGILAVFNLSSPYIISPFLFFLIKILGIECQVIFYSVITLFLMNISRKFDVCFVIALVIFAAATICNIFLNGSLVYCLFPFIHADLTAFLGGGTMQTGFLQTSLYTYGNFFISLAYYLIVVILLFSFTKQLFKKN